jgi:shikimate kinase
VTNLVFLTGYRGSGKTTVARLLAAQLGWRWADADALLEQGYGRSIREIFAAEGEPGFRDKETAVLEEVCRLQAHVIATGGGVVLREENRRRLHEAGKVIWLTADAATLWQRLQGDASTSQRRPNLTVGGIAEVESMLRAREAWYRTCADWAVDTTGRSAAEVAGAIADYLTKATTAFAPRPESARGN